MLALIMFLCIAFGYCIGLINKGITINIVHKPVDNVDKPKGYNESLAGLLPPEVKNYYTETQGQNRF